MPKAGTAPPLRALAEVLDDARLSKSELHVLALDLSKAFDTCEYWSQAMSWKALGMPDEVIKILINMDAGSNSPADPHEGPGATTSGCRQNDAQICTWKRSKTGVSGGANQVGGIQALLAYMD